MKKFFATYQKDILVLGALFLLLAAGLILRFLGRTPGGYVRVECDGTLLGIYPLSEDTEVTFSLPEGEEHNTMVIRSGRAAVSSADCPDKVCVHTGFVSAIGDTIVCLPHRFVITVISAEEAENR